MKLSPQAPDRLVVSSQKYSLLVNYVCVFLFASFVGTQAVTVLLRLLSCCGVTLWKTTWTFLSRPMSCSSASPKDAWACGKGAWASVMTPPSSSPSQTRIQGSLVMESASTSTDPFRREYPRRKEKVRGDIEPERGRRSLNLGMHQHPKRKWAQRVPRAVLHCRLPVQSLPLTWIDPHAVSAWPKAAIALGTALWLLSASLVIIPSFPPSASVCTPSRDLWTAVVRDCWARSWGFHVGCRGMLRRTNFFLLLVCVQCCNSFAQWIVAAVVAAEAAKHQELAFSTVLTQVHSRERKFL